MTNYRVGGVIERPFEFDIQAEDDEEAEMAAIYQIKESFADLYPNEDDRPLIHIEYVDDIEEDDDEDV